VSAAAAFTWVLAPLAALIALPAVAAWRRRARSREASEVALELLELAAGTRRGAAVAAVDGGLLARLRALRRSVPEVVSFELALTLERASPELVADAAQRLALRLKRRVAFERKMLARTRSGLQRGACAAAAAPLALLALASAGLGVPPFGLALLLALEALGCWLLWRVAHVEV
jgi:hypothetical protein